MRLRLLIRLAAVVRFIHDASHSSLFFAHMISMLSLQIDWFRRRPELLVLLWVVSIFHLSLVSMAFSHLLTLILWRLLLILYFWAMIDGCQEKVKNWGNGQYKGDYCVDKCKIVHVLSFSFINSLFTIYVKAEAQRTDVLSNWCVHLGSNNSPCKIKKDHYNAQDPGDESYTLIWTVLLEVPQKERTSEHDDYASNNKEGRLAIDSSRTCV